MPSSLWSGVATLAFKQFFLAPQSGAASTVFAASEPLAHGNTGLLRGGEYISPYAVPGWGGATLAHAMDALGPFMGPRAVQPGVDLQAWDGAGFWESCKHAVSGSGSDKSQ